MEFEIQLPSRVGLMHFLIAFMFFRLCISLFAFLPTSPDYISGCQRHDLNETRESDSLRVSVDSGGLDSMTISLKFGIASMGL